MHIYPIASPPKTPGIYLLRNPTRGLFYVGKATSLWRRWQEWKACFANHIGIKSKVLLEVIQSTSRDEWEFCVLAEVSLAELLERERGAIQEFDRIGIPLLNFDVPAKGTQNAAKTIVTDDAGNSLSYSEAARLTGRSLDTLSKRLMLLRKKGRNRVSLADLRKWKRLPPGVTPSLVGDAL